MSSTISELLKALTRKDTLWAKGIVIPGQDPKEWRRDIYGSVMLYSAYGDTSSPYGWEIDHIDPDGPDEVWNLQPLHWLNNRRKSDKTPMGFLSDLLGLSRRR